MTAPDPARTPDALSDGAPGPESVAVRATVRREGGAVVITLPMEDVHPLRVALAECPCRATKSIGTMEIRERLSKALGRVQARAARGQR